MSHNIVKWKENKKINEKIKEKINQNQLQFNVENQFVKVDNIFFLSLTY